MNLKSEQNSTWNAPALVNLNQYDQAGYSRGKSAWFVLLWWLIQAIAFPLTIHNFNSLRCALLRLFGATIGKKVVIRPTARFTYPWKITIGDYSWIGDDVVFYSLDNIEVGAHTVISQKSYLCTGSHDFQDPTFKLITKPIMIGNGVWVATDCFVAPGVKIGSNAVIGARSSVLKDIPPQQVAWGSPCVSRYPRKMNPQP